MKTNPKRKSLAAILACAAAAVLLLSVLLSGCASQHKENLADTNPAKAEYSMEDGGYALTNAHLENAIDAAGSTTITSSKESGRFVIATASITAQTKTYDAFNAALKADLVQLKGYTDGYEEWNYDDYRQAEITARVPSEKLDAFLESLEKNATVTGKSVSTADVTNDMIDTGSKKKSLEAEEAALIAILEKAKTVEDIITVQDRISEVRAELESYAKHLAQLTNQTSYSTVHITINEVNRIVTPSQSFGTLAGTGFLSSLRSIGSGIRSFALWFISAIPYLVLLAVPAAVIIIVIKRVRKNKKAKKAAPKA